MSHKSQIATTLNNKKFLLKALDDLGFKYQVAEEGKKLKTKGNYNQVTDVDILITSNGTNNYNNAIGFNRESDGTYTATGDFYGLRTADGRSVTQEMLKCEVTAHSKEAEICERLSASQFHIDPTSRKEDNSSIKFELHRWC